MRALVRTTALAGLVALAACGGGSSATGASATTTATSVAPGAGSTAAATPGTTAEGAASSSPASVATTTASAPTDGCRGDASPVLCFSVALTGAVEVAGTGIGDTGDSPKTCAEWAPGTKLGGVTLRLMPSSVAVDGHAVAPDLAGPYAGPGTYDLADVAAVGDGQIAIDDRVFEHRRGVSTATVTFAADGSGRLEVDGLTELGAPGSTLSGTMTWTCGDARP